MIRTSYGFLKKEKLLPHKHWTRFNCFRLCNNSYLIFKKTKYLNNCNINKHSTIFKCIGHRFGVATVLTQYCYLPKYFGFFFPFLFRIFKCFLFVFKSNSAEVIYSSALYRPFAGSRDQSHGMIRRFSLCKHLIFSLFKMLVVLGNNLLIVDLIPKVAF